MNALLFVLLGIIESVVVIVLFRYLMNCVFNFDDGVINITTLLLAIGLIVAICCFTPNFTKMGKLPFEEVEKTYFEMQDKRQLINGEIDSKNKLIEELQENYDKENKKKIKLLKSEQKKLLSELKNSEKTIIKYEKRYNLLKNKIEKREVRKQRFMEVKEKCFSSIKYIIIKISNISTVNKIIILVSLFIILSAIVVGVGLHKACIRRKEYKRKQDEENQKIHETPVFLVQEEEKRKQEENRKQDEENQKKLLNQKIHELAEFFYENKISASDVDDISNYLTSIKELDKEIKNREKAYRESKDSSAKGLLTKAKNKKKRFETDNTKISSLYNKIGKENFDLYLNNQKQVNTEIESIVCKIKLEHEQKLKDLIPTVVEYFVSKNIPVTKIRESQECIKNYEGELNRLDNSIKEAEKAYKNVSNESGFLNFTKTERLKVTEKQLNTEHNRRDSFIFENKTNYDNSVSFINSLPEGYIECSEKFGNQIENEIQNLKSKMEQERIDIAKQQYQAELNAINENKEREIENGKLEQLREELKITIDEIGNYILVIQNALLKNSRIDNVQILKSLEDCLDFVVDNKDNVPNEYKNNIQRARRKIDSVFNLCSNKDTILENIEIIKDLFNRILM